MTDIEEDLNREQWIVHRHYFELAAKPFSLPIYPDARIVHVGRKQGDRSATAHVWETHRTDLVRPRVVPSRWFVVRGTGDPVEDVMDFVGLWMDGPFVFSMFEVGKP